MDYTDDSVAAIAEAYANLKSSLDALKEAKEGNDRAIIFGYVSDRYQVAWTSLVDLESVSPEVKERLKINDLERMFFEFSNIPIGVPFHTGK